MSSTVAIQGRKKLKDEVREQMEDKHNYDHTSDYRDKERHAFTVTHCLPSC